MKEHNAIYVINVLFTGLVGLFLAAMVAQDVASVSIKHLRNMNSYVRAAFEDWHSRCNLQAFTPLQLAPGIFFGSSEHNNGLVAGTSSFGMSGVNAHALVKQASEHCCFKHRDSKVGRCIFVLQRY